MPNVDLNGAISAALNGNPISFPTDTVPALATLPAYATEIFAIKQRSPDKPLILMVGEVADLWQFTTGTDREREIWQAVADRYFPGALTLVLPASAAIPAVMNPLGNHTIGLRVPDCEIARAILRQTGALATTSANLSGEPPLLTMSEIGNRFPQVFALQSDSDDLPTPRLPSTVIQWHGSGWKLLRQGGIEFSDLD
ncbi:L-threonylcarbamoyladenylate synthase [Chamaesiphon sp. OTE_20_metabat_361]|uniref:L-threonylcarbamoyladenylate synthase n=1 Tax=Chamaesiphon sp. OTE_20_metabat_361 TaxID=2964689 RepID=UPI00286BF2BA|nr:L-threonylcarbamoyladenylate synthase [Chamaesiphon sp. OTE_20_metabat_361]